MENLTKAAKELVRRLRAKQRIAERSAKDARLFETRLKAAGRATGYRRAIESLEDLLINEGVI